MREEDVERILANNYFGVERVQENLPTRDLISKLVKQGGGRSKEGFHAIVEVANAEGDLITAVADRIEAKNKQQDMRSDELEWIKHCADKNVERAGEAVHRAQADLSNALKNNQPVLGLTEPVGVVVAKTQKVIERILENKENPQTKPAGYSR